MNLDNIKKQAEKIVCLNSVNDLPLTNIAKIIGTAEIKLKGFYTATIDGVKTLFILESTNA